MDLKGSKTEKNLQTAFSNESQGRNKYTFYASCAKKEGYEQISRIFEETANNEKEHGKIWFKLLTKDISFDTMSNLKDAVSSEDYEYTTLYPDFAKTAKEEGFEEIATLFEKVASIEKTHRDRYKKLLQNMENNSVFKKDTDIVWECGKCGFSYSGKEAMEKCPVCGHPKSYFFEKAKNF